MLYSKVGEYTRLLGNLFVYTEPIDAQFESHSNSSNKPFRDSTILKKKYLKGYDFWVVHLRHVMIGKRVAGLVIDLETGIELQHIQELQNKDNKNNN